MARKHKSAYTFNAVPRIRHKRNFFDMSFGHKFSCNVGQLVPFYSEFIYPGDTFKCKEFDVVRLSNSTLVPPMDNLIVDKYFFFVPYRLIYDDWESVMGENKLGKWAQNTQVDLPLIPLVSGHHAVAQGTVGDHLGYPLNIDGRFSSDINVAGVRAFALIYDYWFRDENNIDPMLVQTGAAKVTEAFNNNAWSPSNYCGKLPNVSKVHDYFTSCLPDPQKSVVEPTLPLGAWAPIITRNGEYVTQPVGQGLSFYDTSGDTSSLITDSGEMPLLGLSDPSSGASYLNLMNADGTASADYSLAPANLWADLSEATAATWNDVRKAAAIALVLERSARSGTRYKEVLSATWGVTSPDSRLQYPEFLGGKRSPIQFQQINQTSVSVSSSQQYLGQPAGYSLTNTGSAYTKGFVEHGIVIGCFCIRQASHTYQQGLRRGWKYHERFDFYDPAFAHLGEVPVMCDEIYGDGPSVSGKIPKEAVFGYQECWADLRCHPNSCAGQMRVDAANSFKAWHFADDYSTTPVVSEDFITETPEYVDRCLNYKSTSGDQFLVDCYFKQDSYRELPLFGTPGLIDHA